MNRLRKVPVTDWTEVVSPPDRYEWAIRRSFPSGLQVLVLAKEVDDAVLVLSSVDHGTPRGTRVEEGSSKEPDEIVRLMVQTCERWNASEPKEPLFAGPRRSYYYTKPEGGVSAAVSRDQLFDLVAQGTITWDCQVWEETEGMAAEGRWSPITAALGFPQGPGTGVGSDA